MDGNGQWNEVQVATFNVATTQGTRRGLSLASPLPMGFPAMPPAAPNVGGVSTPDRVHYQLYNHSLWRDQCWGSVGSPASAPILAVACSPGPDGTGWEELASQVSSLSFAYLDAAGNPLQVPLSTSALNQVATVRIQLTLNSPGGRLETEVVDATPRNRGGL
jgi:hypothetical protein